MKLEFFTLFLLLITIASCFTCDFDETQQQYLDRHPEFKDLADEQLKTQQQSEDNLMNTQERSTGVLQIRRIPVVWHILYHKDSPLTKISLATIDQEMQYINDWFSAQNIHFDKTSDAFASSAAQAEDLRIEFVLAAFDEFGNPTNGVVYKESPVALTCERHEIYSSNAGGVTIWDRSKYLNFVTCDLTAQGGFGYASSLPIYAFEPEIDGIVMLHHLIGEPAYAGSVSAHEIGHFLGLRHPFEHGCYGSGDRVDDTPSTAQPWRNVVDVNQPCPGFNGADDSDFQSCGHAVMVQNIMDYNVAGCQTAFTKGQAAIMRSWLDSLSVRSSLVLSPGLPIPCEIYDCTGKFCGNDGCGGTCGFCSLYASEVCSDSGECVVEVPCPSLDCENKECGHNGCGGNCGTCSLGQSCGADQRCSSSNEICENATVVISGESYIGNTRSSAISTECDIGDSGIDLSQPVWFSFIATQTEVLLLQPSSSKFDNIFTAVYSGSCASLTCNDYNVLEYDVIAGNEYFIAISGFGGEQGEFMLNVDTKCSLYNCEGKTCGDDGCGGSCGSCSIASCSDSNCISPNSQCSDSMLFIPIGGPENFQGETSPIGESISCGIGGETFFPLWYDFISTTTGVFTVNTHGSDFDTTLAVFSGSCSGLTCEEFNDETNGFTSEISFNAEVGKHYFIIAGGHDENEFGFLNLNIFSTCPTYDCTNKRCGDDGCGGSCGNCNVLQSCSASQDCVAVNDECEGATQVVVSRDGNYYQSFADIGAEVVTCDSIVLNDPVWFSFTVSQRKRIYLSTNLDRFSTDMALFSGRCSDLFCIESNGSQPSGPLISAFIEFTALPGINYLVAVSSDHSEYAEFYLHITEIDDLYPISSTSQSPSPAPPPTSPTVESSPVPESPTPLVSPIEPSLSPAPPASPIVESPVPESPVPVPESPTPPPASPTVESAIPTVEPSPTLPQASPTVESPPVPESPTPLPAIPTVEPSPTLPQASPIVESPVLESLSPAPESPSPLQVSPTVEPSPTLLQASPIVESSPVPVPESPTPPPTTHTVETSPVPVQESQTPPASPTAGLSLLPESTESPASPASPTVEPSITLPQASPIVESSPVPVPESPTPPPASPTVEPSLTLPQASPIVESSPAPESPVPVPESPTPPPASPTAEPSLTLPQASPIVESSAVPVPESPTPPSPSPTVESSALGPETLRETPSNTSSQVSESLTTSRSPIAFRSASIQSEDLFESFDSPDSSQSSLSDSPSSVSPSISSYYLDYYSPVSGARKLTISIFLIFTSIVLLL